MQLAFDPIDGVLDERMRLAESRTDQMEDSQDVREFDRVAPVRGFEQQCLVGHGLVSAFRFAHLYHSSWER